ncbi:hypothetical protein ANN_14149 [Periplaneta americana]|uniref:Uncharacterized protein n=1 Tax=Periplaneta americana TaxID=6978 RepID=A0ABQ8SXN2_PERAM|nr:hypothetical protein ANN_14149 [Periplaneta americana]
MTEVAPLVATSVIDFQQNVVPTIGELFVGPGLRDCDEAYVESNLKDLEKVKAAYLKRVLGLSRFTPSRIVYELTREPMLLEDLRLQFLLPSVSAYESTDLEHQCKKAEIWEEFYVTDVMAREDWKEANYLQRHLVTRFAIHGFHFKICRNTSFHDPNEECMCLLCNELCGRYHVMECKNRLVSLTKFCSSES